MTKDYDHITAFHYSTYRPPLHPLILKKCISPHDKFNHGLDIGCGTGQSSIALANYCDEVTGIDTSQDMIQRSIPHPRVQYLYYKGDNIGFKDDHFDIVTLAGSLYYAKSQKLLNNIIRITGYSAKIIVYDFQIMLDEILFKLGINTSDIEHLNYNHQEDFSGLFEECIQEEISGEDKIQFNITNSNLVHLLLSSKGNYLYLEEKFKAENLQVSLMNILQKISNNKEQILAAYIFFKVYRNIKK